MVLVCGIDLPCLVASEGRKRIAMSSYLELQTSALDMSMLKTSAVDQRLCEAGQNKQHEYVMDVLQSERITVKIQSGMHRVAMRAHNNQI